jgi:hypothetical protein
VLPLLAVCAVNARGLLVVLVHELVELGEGEARGGVLELIAPVLERHQLLGEVFLAELLVDGRVVARQRRGGHRGVLMTFLAM